MKKPFIKHPLYLLISLGFIILFGGSAIGVNLDRIHPQSQLTKGLIICSLVVLINVVLFVGGAKFHKIIKREQKTAILAIQKNAFTGKKFTLIQKATITANLCLVIGGILFYVAWILLLPYGKCNALGYWIFRVITTLISIYGFVFSFFFKTKFMIYQNGKLIIKTENGYLSILPSQLIEVKTKNPKKTPSSPRSQTAPSFSTTTNYDSSNSFSKFMDDNQLHWIQLVLCDRMILLKHAELTSHFREKLKAIKKLEQTEK